MRLFTIFLLSVLIVDAHDHVKQTQALIDRLVEIAMSDTMDSRTRVEALDMLGHSENDMVIDVLISASYDEDWSVRKQSIISLKFYDFENVHKRLFELSQDTDPKNQIIAIETLYIAYQEGDLNILVNYLDHEDPKIRLLAAQSFWYIADPEYTGALQSAFDKETDPEVKRKLRSTILIRDNN